MPVWENQRYFTLAGWFPPPRFERPKFEDDDGQAVEFEDGAQPSLNPLQWKFIVSPHTDAEGWHYSTSFSSVSQPRDGGRASKRATDCVRCREWVETGNTVAEESSVNQNQKRTLTLYRGLSAFIGILNEVLQRHRIWEVLPWDPGAWLVVHGEHQEYFRALLSLEAAFSQSTIRLNCASLETLQEMQCAARHARAAYGYVMWAGHMESVDRVLMLHTIHNKFFDPVAGASTHANTKAVCALADINEEDVLLIDWSNSQYRPCHYVALDRRIQRVMLVIRGSSETGDIITDITGQSVSVSLCGKTGKIHSGAMSAATYIQCQTRETLEKAADTYPGWPLLIVGHSLGGGVAAILTLLLKEENLKFPRVYSIGIGSASVMSEELAEQCSGSVTTVIRRGDVVPRLSCHSVEALLLELSNSSPAKRAVTEIFHSASSALQSVKDKIFQAGLKLQELELTQVERNTYCGEGLKNLGPCLEETDAIDRAVQAARHALESSHSAEPSRIKPGSSSMSAETATRNKPNGAQTVEKKQTSQGVFPGECGSFTPMYPAGQVFWILPVSVQKKSEEENTEADWWKKLQDWGKETLQKSKSIVQMPGGESVSRPANANMENSTEDCASVVGTSIIRDLEWMDAWFKQQSVKNEVEKNALSELETNNQAAPSPPEMNRHVDRSSTNPKRRITEAGTSPRKTMLLEAERKSFGRILLHPDMMSDHLPTGYLTAIRSLVTHTSSA